MIALEVGKMAVPQGWSSRVQAVWIEPENTRLAAPLARSEVKAAPRANIALAREPAKHPSAAAARDAFLVETGKTIPMLRRLSDCDVAFEDGTAGVGVTIAFPATPQITVLQLHYFRLDGEVMTQLVATISEQRGAELETKIAPIMRTYSPGQSAPGA